MKTIMDAVNELRGAWPVGSSWGYVCLAFSKSRRCIVALTSLDKRAAYKQICTADEFNNLVAELSAAEWISEGFMEKFTKGEWVARVDSESPQVALIRLGNGGGFDLSRSPDCIANAYLIAVAPEMYAEIEQECLELIELIATLTLTKYSDDYYYYNNKLLRKQYLLAKARGEK